MDHSQIIHAIITTISLYLFIVFAWWWQRSGSATTIYGVTCFLMLSISVTHAGAWFVYCQMIHGTPQQYLIFNSPWWPYRNYLMCLALMSYAVHITERIVDEWRK